MKARTKFVGLAVVAAALTGGIYLARSQEMGPHFGHGMLGMPPGMMGVGRIGPGMGPHDERTIGQLETIHTLLANHASIRRTVTNVPDGIRTLTESDDPEIAELIKKHVSEMGKRLAERDDPGLPIESDNLHAIFRNGDKLRTTYEMTERGMAVLQTSDDPATVTALQAHAQEVVDLVKGGMAALHEAMMNRGE